MCEFQFYGSNQLSTTCQVITTLQLHSLPFDAEEY